jgi:hypothetical protein
MQDDHDDSRTLLCILLKGRAISVHSALVYIPHTFILVLVLLQLKYPPSYQIRVRSSATFVS